jgi:acyl carrier protein
VVGLKSRASASTIPPMEHGGARPDAQAVGAGAPSEDLFHAVAAHVATVLGVEEVALEDDFLMLGGTSLKAVMLASRLLDDFGVEVALEDLFNARSVREIGELVQAAQSRAGGALS